MRAWRHISLVVAKIAFAATLCAQLPDYHVQMIADQEGLLNAEIISMARDKRGYLWLLSSNSIQRTDGRKCWYFPVIESARQIFVDSSDRIWLVTRNEVMQFVNDYAGFRAVPFHDKMERLPLSLFDSGGKIFLISTRGLLQWNNLDMRFVADTHFRFSESKEFTRISARSADYVFLSDSDSLYSLHRQSGTVASMASGLNVSAMVGLSENQVLVSDFSSRTFHYDFVHQRKSPWHASLVTGNPNDPYLRMSAGVVLGKDSFLLSSNLGFIIYNQKRGSFRLPVFYSRGQLLRNNQSVRQMFKDELGNVFMSHAEGLAFFNPQESPIHYIMNYRYANDGLPDIDVRGFTEDAEGNIWIATINGLARLNVGNGMMHSFNSTSDELQFDYPSIRYLLYHQSMVWVGTGGNGVWMYDMKARRFSRPTLKKADNSSVTSANMEREYIWKLLPMQDGNILVVCGRRVYSIDQESLEASVLPMAIPGISRSAMQDSTGRILLGGTNGLVCYDKQFQRLFSISDSLPDKRVAAILEWKRNRVLIGTKGLYELVVDDKGIHSFRKLTIFPDNRFIYCMEQDSLGRIWMGTDRGLYRLDLSRSELRAFDIADNIQVRVFNSNGLFLSGNGLLFAGGRMGLNYLNPYVERTRSIPLKPWVESASFGNNDSIFFQQYQPLILNHFQRNVNLRIAVPEFATPYALRYRYRINSSAEWVDNGQNDQVLLRELAPGSYRIDISVSRDAVEWYEQKNAISFFIRKPWWMQWWFRIATLLGGLALVWFIRRYRRRKKEEAEFQFAVDYFANSAYEHASTEEILWDICRNAIARLGLEDCVIYLLDEERKMLVQKAAFGAKSNSGFEIVSPIEIPVGKAIVGHVAATGKAEIIRDTSIDSRYLADDKPRLSELTIPIIHQSKVIGIIDSEHSRRNFFRQKHMETLQRIASLCASKISRSMAIAELKKAEEKLHTLNTKIAATKYMNLRLQMNPHFLFNALNSIQHLIVAHQTNEAYRYLSVFSRFLRSVLQFADKNVINLEEEIQLLEMYISLEQLGSDKRFCYQIVVGKNLETEEVLIPPLIIQPLVENAIWHGLMPAEGEKQLNILFEENSDDQLVCVVEDNGIGREAAAQLEKGKMGQLAYESKSTAIIRERLELLKEKTGKDAAIHVEDKKLNGRAMGTRVTVIIPYYNRDEV